MIGDGEKAPRHTAKRALPPQDGPSPVLDLDFDDHSDDVQPIRVARTTGSEHDDE